MAGRMIKEDKPEFKKTLETQNEINSPVLLLMEEDASLNNFLKEELQKSGYSVWCSSSLEANLSLLYEIRPDIVLLGKKFWSHRLLKEKLDELLIPVMMVSNDNSKETRVRVFELGTDELIDNPYDIEEFIHRLKRQIFRRIRQEQVSLLDPLTHMFNHRYLEMRFRQFYAELTRLGTPYSIVLINLDQFKKVNETQGYFAGDVWLQKFSAFVRKQVRSNDVITRVEGDTFALLLPNTVSANAVRLLQRILHASKNSNMESYPFTFSASVMEIDHREEQLEKCIKKLEPALQEAKIFGGGRVAEVKQDKVALTQTFKIAVVDDDPIIRSVLSQVLRKITVPFQSNIEFRTFPDGLDFLESEWGVDNCPYLVILDGMMPKMDGLEVLQKIRKERRRDRYTIMMLTTRKNNSDIERAMQLGADDYMTKPFKMAELEAKIESLIMRINA